MSQSSDTNRSFSAFLQRMGRADRARDATRSTCSIRATPSFTARLQQHFLQLERLNEPSTNLDSVLLNRFPPGAYRGRPLMKPRVTIRSIEELHFVRLPTYSARYANDGQRCAALDLFDRGDHHKWAMRLGISALRVRNWINWIDDPPLYNQGHMNAPYMARSILVTL